MGVYYPVLADAATAAEGKHYIHGAGWDTVFATAFPVTQPSLGVALRLRVPWHDTNQPTKISVDVVNADNLSILPEPIGGEVNVGRPPHLHVGDDQVVG